MADSSYIENGVIAALGADATLLALVPDGVYYAEAPPNAKRFVIVQLMDSVDEAAFSKGRAYEDTLLMVKAVMLSTAGGNIQSAAARIDTLLEDGTITASGFTFSTIHREGRIRVTEVDDEDSSLRWQHRGGFYRVQMAVT
jgi:hypothetical protein